MDRKLLILVVDPSQLMRRMVGVALKAISDCTVIEAEDASEALGKLKNGLEPKLIITDKDIPGMDGLELTKKIRGMCRLSETPVVVMSSPLVPGRTKVDWRSFGATAWIEKPFSVEHLHSVVAGL